MDITERKLAEEALRQSEERLLLASQAAGFGTYTFDFETGVGDWSPELMALMGLGSGERMALDAERAPECLYPEDRAATCARQWNWPTTRAASVGSIDYRIVWPSGAVRCLRVSGLTEFAGEGEHRRPWRAAGAVLDITGRKQAEEALRGLLARKRRCSARSITG